MNKIFKYITSLLIVLVFVTACEESDATVDFVTDNVERGAILRTQQLVSPSFDLLDPNSVFAVLLEYRDNEDNSLLQSTAVYATYIDNTDDGEDNSKPEIPYEIVGGDSFENGEPYNNPQY